MADGVTFRRVTPQVEVPASVVSEAARWLVRLQGAPDGDVQAACERWRQADPRHELAWQRLAALSHDVGQATRVDPRTRDVAAETVLGATQRQARRRTLKWVVGGVAAGGAAWSLAEAQLAPGTVYRTAAGESRDLTLEDGTRVRLNTQTRLRVTYDTQVRSLVLVEGEILVDTAADARPLHVRAGEVTLTPIGTRFVVRHLPGEEGLLAVLEGTVRIEAGPDIPARQQSRFGGPRPSGAEPLHGASAAWLSGMLVAERMPLPRFLRELNRYRPGWVTCASSLDGLQVTGAFRVADTDHTLALVARALGVQLRYRTRYWVTLLPE
ncbi:Fe2+-dicitrate sensor, membrane component [plant metagenome]